jgi:hypothetical protein
MVWRYDEDFLITADLRPGRVNLAVDDGRIVGAYVEGCEEPGFAPSNCP